MTAAATDVKTIWIKRDLAEVGAAAEAVKGWAAEVLNQEQSEAIELALTEALTNAIRHGTAESATKIGVHVETGAEGIAVEIADSSPPMPQHLLDEAGADKIAFDPADLEAISEGGRGLSLIVLMMDEVAYVRVNGQVRLRMLLRR